MWIYSPSDCCESVAKLDLFAQNGCLTLLSIAVMNTMTKSNLGRKRFIGLTLPHDSLSPREIKAKSSRQEPGGRY